MGIQACVFVIVSSMMPKILNYISRAKGCMIGMVLVIVGIAGMGTLYFVDDPRYFIGCSFFWKILLGIGSGFISTSCRCLN